MTAQTTYREDEISIIFKNCTSLPELDKASQILGYLNRIGAQAYKPVITVLKDKRKNELIKNINT